MNKHVLTIALTAWTMAIGVTMRAQDVNFFNSRNGLSNSRVGNIYEDQRRNIWICTQDGLNRYDGVKMSVYRHQNDDPTSLLQDETTCVLDYDQHGVLIGTGAGVQLYSHATDRFTYVPFVGSPGDTIASRTVSMTKLRNGKVYVCYAGYGYGQLTKDAEGNLRVQILDELNTEGNSNPTQILEDSRKDIWIINANRRVYHFHKKQSKVYPELDGARRLCYSSTGHLFAATATNGIWAYDERNDRFRQIVTGAEVGGVLYSFSPWSNGRMFVCTDGAGLRILDERTGKLSLSTIRTNDFDLPTSNVKSALSDSYGNVWVGIYYKGVMMKPINQSAFEYIGQRSISRNIIGQNAVFDIAKGLDGTLWVATDNDGLFHISSDRLSSVHYGRQNDSSAPRAFTSIVARPDGSVLLGTFSDGLWLMKDGRFTCIDHELSGIFDIIPDALADRYWIATMGHGFYFYDHAAGTFLHYTADWNRGEEGTRIIGNPYVYSLLLVGGTLYVGTSDGLTMAFPEHHGIIQRESRRTLPRMAIHHLAVSSDGQTIWAATNGGLVSIDRQNNAEHTYTKADGLPSNNISQVVPCGSQLWVGTDYGLCCLDLTDNSYTNFYYDDGLQDNEFSQGAALMDEGTLFFGGIGGITYFERHNMEAWKRRQRDLVLRLVDVYVGGQVMHAGDLSGSYEVLRGLVNEQPHVELSHNDNHFTIELSVDGVFNQHVLYEYSINGAAWKHQSGSSNSIVFDNLSPGVYHISLRASALGVYSNERMLEVVVHPAWYASAWAKVIYMLLGLFVCWLLYQYMRRHVEARRLEQRTRQQEEINDARIQFFMNISHEIRTPMTLIISPLEKLLSTDHDEERQRQYKLIRQNSKRILQLINQMMDVRKIEQGRFLLDYSRVEMVSFVQNIFDVFATNAQGRGITYEFRHDMDRLDVYVDANNCDKLVMNLLSNAFKFTPDGGTIIVELLLGTDPMTVNRATEADMAKLQTVDTFSLIVTDSGIGISDEAKPHVFERFYSGKHQPGYIGTGIGLNLASLLVRLHGGCIGVGDNPEGHGTRLGFTMPLGNEKLLKTHLPDDYEQDDDTTEEDDGDGTYKGPKAFGMDDEDEEEKDDQLLAIDTPTDTHRKNTVLVEDDDAIRQYVHSELSQDLVIQACKNGQEAWDYIVAHPGKVDLVISDIMMPVMDGLTLCQKLKGNFTTNHIPVVLITALGSDSDRIAGLTNGADAYVSKPFNIDVLRTTAVQLLRSRQMLQGKYNGDHQQAENIDHVEMESPDEHLMKRVMKVINDNLDNPELSVELIADKVGISRVHFYRKMKELTGQAPRDFVKYVRLKEAARLLEEKKLDITGVSIATGFKSLSAFSTNFKSLYGVTPTEWMKKK